jgi:murein DD-endopeptidase MepM/ murein hydrolase activator NlpD
MILSQKFGVFARGLLRRYRLAVLLLMLPCVGVLAAFSIAPDTASKNLPVNIVVQDLPLAVSKPVDDFAAYTLEEPIQRGDTVAALLARLQVRDKTAERILRDGRRTPSLQKLIPGRSVRVQATADGKLLNLQYLNGETLLSIDCSNPDCKISEEIAKLERRVMMSSAEIRQSLFGATEAAGLTDAIALQLVDIFSSDIDFHRDLRKFDRFSVVYEMYFNRSEPARSGRVLAAEFTNQGNTYRAVWFEYALDQGGYYTFDGRSLRKQFLRSPLEFSRISSGYSSARYHPLLREWHAHKGIDYAAPTGTRVRAIADGTVDFAGRQGGYGNLIVLRHQQQYTTWYGHLSGFAKALRSGSRVHQGELIGYIGATGLATGPHLHYEFRVNNVQKNPLGIAMPAAPPITAGQRPRFADATRALDEQLVLLRTTNLARSD